MQQETPIHEWLQDLKAHNGKPVRFFFFLYGSVAAVIDKMGAQTISFNFVFLFFFYLEAADSTKGNLACYFHRVLEYRRQTTLTGKKTSNKKL